MKTPYYSGAFTAAQHVNVEDDDQLRERMLEHRLANRDDVRDIHIVTVPFANVLSSPVGADLVKQASKRSRTDLSWAMHWAVQVGDHFYELQRGYVDPTRTGLRMSKWDQQKQDQILQRYRQGSTAMSNDEIKAVGDKHFSRLNRMHVNKYDLWTNNCQVAVDCMLREIGGLHYYRSKLESLHEWIRQFFCNSMLSITRMYYRRRGCDEEVLVKHEKVLRNALNVMTLRSIHYPKRQWIREDVDAAETMVKKIGAVGDHWFLSVIESSLSLRKGSDTAYIRRGSDGKAELNFTAVKEATKGIFRDDVKSDRVAWLKAMPWLTAGFLVGTLNWAVAVITVAVQHVHQSTQSNTGLKGGLEMSLLGIGISPKLQDGSFSSPNMSKPRVRRMPTDTKSKSLSIDHKLEARYERCFTTAGVPYYYDHLKKSRSWDPPDQQEMCLKITDPPLSKKWEEKQEDGQMLYVNQLTGETVTKRPGPSEIWAIKKKTKPEWVKSTFMALPHGWEMRRTEEGEKYYVDHKNDPPTSTTMHPMRKEIEDERQVLLPEWNVEWDDDRGKKYRHIQTGEIRWKAIDGLQYIPADESARNDSRKPQQEFVEPLPAGWTFSVEDDGQTIYKNEKQRVARTTHPLADKRKHLPPDWEMRYTPGNRRYYVHYGYDEQGSSWWTRNKILKNTTLKNDACGWKLTKNGQWEWFEGGDVAHSEIPLLDLDDPGEIEFREYPFILPMRTTNSNGTFVEPLPPNWVMRTHDDGNVHYWNYKDEVRSDQHPCEEERRNLPALWEMRYTRHGRQYFIHHNDGSTWWTNPREAKLEQQLRAKPGQSQDGWKLAEDGQTWERFEERPDVALAEQSAEDDNTAEAENPEKWQSLPFTREWMRKVGNGERVATAMTRIRNPKKVFKKAEKSNDAGDNLVDSVGESFDDELQKSEDKRAMTTDTFEKRSVGENPSPSETASSGREFSINSEDPEQVPASDLTSEDNAQLPEYTDEMTAEPAEEGQLSVDMDEGPVPQNGAKKKSWLKAFKKSEKKQPNIEETIETEFPPGSEENVEHVPTDPQEQDEEPPLQLNQTTRKSWAKRAFRRPTKSTKSFDAGQQNPEIAEEQPLESMDTEAQAEAAADKPESQRLDKDPGKETPPPAPSSSTSSLKEKRKNLAKALRRPTDSKVHKAPSDHGSEEGGIGEQPPLVAI